MKRKTDFRTELSMYDVWKVKLKRIKLDILAVETEMEGVKAINSEGVKVSTNPQTKINRFYDLSSKLEELEHERNRLESNINYVHKKLLKIKDKTIRQAAIDMYVSNIGVRELAIKYAWSKSELFRKIGREIEKLSN